MNNQTVFTPPKPLETAVLFLVFNRLDTTMQVFEAIRKARPPRLYVAADGPRDSRPGEAEKVTTVREYVTKNIDWPCDVKTLFREKNLGCKYAVSGAITWFFENEEQGIILEDDCLPSQSFFWFCEEMLNKYGNDLRIWQIAGSNFQKGWRRDSAYSYYFSYYGSIWGWATWRSRWEHYDVEMRGYDEIKKKGYLWDLFGNKPEAKFRIGNFDSIQNGLNTWDYQWVYTKFCNSGLSIIPNTNLIINIGFDNDATHTTNASSWCNSLASEIMLPLAHPSFVIRDKLSDDRFAKYHTKFSLINEIKRAVRAFLRRISNMIFEKNR